MSKNSRVRILSDVGPVPLVYNRLVSCPPSLSWVQRQAEDALDLARLATKYNRQGQRVVAARLCAAAEESHYRILVAICDLTDTEADLVEPSVTNLERELYRLTRWVRGRTDSGSGRWNSSGGQ